MRYPTGTTSQSPPHDFAPRYHLRGYPGVVVAIVADATRTTFLKENEGKLVRVVERPLQGRGSRMAIGAEWIVTMHHLRATPPSPEDR